MVLFALSAALHFYIGARLVPALAAPWDIALAAWLVASAVLMPMGLFARRGTHGAWAERLDVAGLFAKGLFSSLLVATCLRDRLLILVGLATAVTPLLVSFSALERLSGEAVPLVALAVTAIGLW